MPDSVRSVSLGVALVFGAAAIATATPPAGAAGQNRQPLPRASSKRPHSNITYTTPITHIVVVVQENRTVDNLFQFLPHADTQRWGRDSTGKIVPLSPVHLDAPYDLDHNHLATPSNPGGFVTEYNSGANDGWDKESFSCHSQSGCPGETAFGYVPVSDVRNYYDMATRWAFSDKTFQVNEGPSFPNHQYMIAGQAGGLFDAVKHLGEAENPFDPSGKRGTAGCDVPGFLIPTIDMTSAYPGVENASNEIFPCEDYQTVFDLIDGGGSGQVNWKYYTPVEQIIWNAPLGVNHLYNKYLQQGGASGNGNFIIDPGGSRFFSDVGAGALPPLTYIVPCGTWSDHPGGTGLDGPYWVSFIANTIGNNPQYWPNTALIVVWDDWGGWFDHVVPGHAPNPYANPLDPLEYGYRVPLLVISPYARAGTVDHKVKTQMAILTFIEKAFGLGNLSASDQRQFSGDDLTTTMFDFTQKPLAYHTEPVPPSLFPATTCTAGPSS